MSRWLGTLARGYVAGESGELGESGVGAPGGGVAHRGRFLELYADAVARGVCDGLFGLIAEVVTLQAATGRSQGGEELRMARKHARPTPVRQEDVATVAYAALN